MKKIDESRFSWDKIQIDYNRGMNLNEIRKKYNISKEVFNRGKNRGFFNQHRGIGHLHTEETKHKLSKKRIEFLRKNPEAHNWSKYHRKSEPAEIFKKSLKNHNINFVEEYRPLKNRFFKVDFAFPDKKIGIEINGNQHYNLDRKTLRSYYRKRKEEIEKNGWKLFDFHYTLVYKDEKLKEIIDFFKENCIGNINYLEQEWEVTSKYKQLRQKEHKKFLEEDRIEKIKNKLISSDIDFSKFGWVGQAARIIGCSHAHVNRWMKKNMEEFYKNECFKRNESR